VWLLLSAAGGRHGINIFYGDILATPNRLCELRRELRPISVLLCYYIPV
jgi:hypothetical protein